MVAALLIAGIGLLLAGLATVGLGIQLDLSFGNTLILTGAVVACTGAILLGLWMVVRELKNLARQLLGPGIPLGSRAGSTQAALTATLGDQAPEDVGFLFGRDQLSVENAGGADPAAQPGPPPWEATRDRGRGEVTGAPESAAAAPAPKPRRNLLFSSSSRKERERAQARVIDPSTLDIPPAVPVAPPAADPNQPQPASFDDAWPKPERSRASDAPPPRRSGRAPSTFTEPAAGADRPAAPNEDQPPVTVLKSGVVDGMAYSLYSDGSIEAQMPEGMMRFASIDELRLHLDQRP
jgi:hypothetical protein